MIQKASSVDPTLYQTDETAWLDTMAELIQEGRFDELDYPHLAEYLFDMAKRDRREVNSRLVVLMKHFLKWNHQPEKRKGGWQSSIIAQQHELQDLCAGGVLRNHALEKLDSAYKRAVQQAAAETELPKDVFPKECPYTLDQLLSQELPPAR
jgi:hypothetical protein